MKKSKYTYFFAVDQTYVGYSWLEDAYIEFPIGLKERVDTLLNEPYAAVSEWDLEIVKKLQE